MSHEDSEMDLEEYNRLSARIRSLQSEADRDRGVVVRILEQFKEEFGTDSIDEIKALKKKFLRLKDAHVRKHRALLVRFQKEVVPRLEQLDAGKEDN